MSDPLRTSSEVDRAETRARFSWWPLVAGLLAIAFYIPGVRALPWGDEPHSLYQAARTFQTPAHIMDPWMGGVFRVLPKLLLMAGLRLWGIRIWPYHLLNILIHAFSVGLVAALASRWSGSRRVGFSASLLFALGFAYYGKAVVVISDVTLLMGLAFLLAGLAFLWSGRWKPALVLYLLGVASHEVILVAPLLLVPLASLQFGGDRMPWERGVRRMLGERGVPRATAVILLALVPLAFVGGQLGRFCGFEVRMMSFALLPFTESGVSVIAGRAGDVILRAIALMISWRLLAGAGVVALLAILALRGRTFYALAAAWAVLFCAPAWAVVHSWEGTWLELRYLYVPAVGLSIAAAGLIDRLARRHRAASTLALAIILAWSVTVSALWLSRHITQGQSPAETAARELFYQEIAEVDPRYVLAR